MVIQPPPPSWTLQVEAAAQQVLPVNARHKRTTRLPRCDNPGAPAFHFAAGESYLDPSGRRQPRRLSRLGLMRSPQAMSLPLGRRIL
jgi:hypothetical protein